MAFDPSTAKPVFDLSTAKPSGEAGQLPEIGESKAFNTLSGPSFAAALGVLSAGSQDEQAQILLSQFPGAQIREDENKDLIVRFPDEEREFMINRPGLSARDIAGFAFRALAFTPAGRTRQFATQQIGKRIGQVAGQSAATEAGLQAVELATGGEFDPGEVVLAGVTGAGGQGATEALTPLARRIASGRAGRTLQQGRAVAPAVDPEGLSRAQSLGDPFLLEEQAFVGQLPEGARPALKFLSEQNETASNSVRSFIDQFGTPQSVIVGPKILRDTATKTVELAKSTRSAKASPLYKQAFANFRESGEAVEVKPVIDFIDSEIQRFPKGHPARKALTQFRKDVTKNADDLERLQGVKEIVDTKIAGFANRPTSATNKAMRSISEAEDILLQQMDEVSPDFRVARETFARESVPVDSIRASLVGRVADIPDERLKAVAGSIFDPDATSPALVRQAKKAIESMDGGTEAWEGIVRVQLERQLGRVRSVGEDLSVLAGQPLSNLPSQFRTALFPNKKAKDVLLSAMSGEQREAALELERWLIRASQGRPGGSQTGIRKEISRRFDKGFVSAMRRFLSTPITSTSEIGEEALRSRRVAAIGEAIFDPDWVGEFNRVRRLAGQQTENFLKLFQAVARRGKAGVQAIRSQVSPDNNE